MRLLLDTNVVVSALVWGGVPFELLSLAAAGDVELCTSPALMDELRGVLGRKHIASRLLERQSSVDQAVGLYGELAISVSPLVVPRAVPRDEDDDHVVAAALAAKADLIVSGDGDLLSVRRFGGIGIVLPAEAVRLVRGAA